MPEPSPIRRAREAYRAYGQTTDFKNYQGNPMPAWDDLTEKIREAWVAASTAAACHHDPVTTSPADTTTPLGDEDEVMLAENIARLRYVAASLERRENLSFAVAVSPEKAAPFFSWRMAGEDMAGAYHAGVSLRDSLRRLDIEIGVTTNHARLGWRAGNATPPADEAG
jgi:hypothetical protein